MFHFLPPSSFTHTPRVCVIISIIKGSRKKPFKNNPYGQFYRGVVYFFHLWSSIAIELLFWSFLRATTESQEAEAPVTIPLSLKCKLALGGASRASRTRSPLKSNCLKEEELPQEGVAGGVIQGYTPPHSSDTTAPRCALPIPRRAGPDCFARIHPARAPRDATPPGVTKRKGNSPDTGPPHPLGSPRARPGWEKLRAQTSELDLLVPSLSTSGSWSARARGVGCGGSREWKG